MSGRVEKLERKEARRILGERTTSVVGSIRERVSVIEETFPSSVANLESRVRGVEMALTLRQTVQSAIAGYDNMRVEWRKEDAQTVEFINRRSEFLLRRIDDLSARLDLLAAATFRARLRWLFTGKWPAAPAERG